MLFVGSSGSLDEPIVDDGFLLKPRPCSSCQELLEVDATLQCPCGLTQYCSSACQKAHWSTHRPRCSAGRTKQSVEICSHCRRTGIDLFVCKCRQVFYCSSDCQRCHWRSTHQHNCNAARKDKKWFVPPKDKNFQADERLGGSQISEKSILEHSINMFRKKAPKVSGSVSSLITDNAVTRVAQKWLSKVTGRGGDMGEPVAGVGGTAPVVDEGDSSIAAVAEQKLISVDNDPLAFSGMMSHPPGDLPAAPIDEPLGMVHDEEPDPQQQQGVLSNPEQAQAVKATPMLGDEDSGRSPLALISPQEDESTQDGELPQNNLQSQLQQKRAARISMPRVDVLLPKLTTGGLDSNESIVNSNVQHALRQRHCAGQSDRSLLSPTSAGQKYLAGSLSPVQQGSPDEHKSAKVDVVVSVYVDADYDKSRMLGPGGAGLGVLLSGSAREILRKNVYVFQRRVYTSSGAMLSGSGSRSVSPCSGK